jgi:hypothetical protein
MRKRRIKLLNNKYVIAYHTNLMKNKDILEKQNYMIKYFINYQLMCLS